MRVAGVLCGVVLGICECEEVIFGVLYSFVGVALVFQGACSWADELIGRRRFLSVWWADLCVSCWQLLELVGLVG